MALTVKSIRSMGILVSSNPEKFVQENVDLSDIENRLANEIRLSQWKRVEVEEKGKRKYVMRVVQSSLLKAEFLNHVKEQKTAFASHVSRVKEQFDQMRGLKQNLPAKHAIVHMDFAENYACKSANEIQSAYWNQTSVTLHPVVVYHKHCEDGPLNHRSFVVVSDTLSHNANTVLCVLDAIIPEVQTLVPDLDVCHYWTDSPTSQYRNRIIFDTVANHKDRWFGCKAYWNYFESGHGKGPCDGLGGTVKRMADMAVKTGKCTIQDAQEFFAWATQSSLRNVSFKYISDEEVQQKVSDMAATAPQLKPVKGTMKVHAVFGAGISKLFVRNTSCYCEECILGTGVCHTWRLEVTRKTENIDRSRSPPEQNNTEVSENGNGDRDVSICTDIGSFVAAVYGTDWFVGTVIGVDAEDGEIEVSFMEKKKSLFQWPRRADELWVGIELILCNIQSPIQTGKSKRMFRVCEEDSVKIQSCFERYVIK